MSKKIGAAVLIAAFVAFACWKVVVEPSGGAVASQPAAQAGQAGGGGRGRDAAATVTTARVSVRPYTDVFSAIGTVRAEDRVQILSEVSGKVVSTRLVPNSEVAAGDPLVVLEDRAEQLQVRIAAAQLKETEDTLRRMESLHDSGSAAVSDVQVQEAATAVDIARTSLEVAEYDLTRRTIAAPIAGQIGLSDIEVGQLLTSGSEVATITNLAKLRVAFTLPDRALDFVRRGLAVDLGVPTKPGAVYAAEVVGVDTEIDPATRQIKVEARISSDDMPVLPGSVVSVRARRPSQPAPSVPALAVTWSREGAGVWLLRDGVTTRVPVQILHRSGDRIWLEGGLADGDEIVVEGTQKVREGGGVSVLRSAEPDDDRVSENDRTDNGETAAQEAVYAN